MRIRPGRFLSVGIVSVWASLVAVQLSRSVVRPESRPLVDLTPSASSTPAELTQRGVFYRGTRIGFMRQRLTPLEDGLRTEQTGELTLNLLGRERRMSIEGSADTGPLGELRAFQFQLSTSSQRSIFQTRVVGEVVETQLRMTVLSGTQERTESRDLAEPIVLPITLYRRVATQGLKVGDVYRLRLLDPMTLSEGEVEVEVKELEVVRWGSREEEAYRIQTKFAGLTTTAWVSGRGEVLQEETALGWTLRKEAPGTGLEARAGGSAPDVLMQSAVPAIGFAEDPEGLIRAELKLSGFPEGFAQIDGGRQTLDGDIVRIEVETPPYETQAELPDEQRKEALAADAFVQSDNEEIRAHAMSLTKGLDDVEKARVLSQWIFENLTKSPTLSLPSAREIFEQRVGDCNEHTVLFAALARSVLLPTRISTGLTYTGGQFYYHAWPEVWVGRWLALDPTLGQFPADPLHLRLLTGGLESQYEVLSLMGRGATIEVLSTR